MQLKIIQSRNEFFEVPDYEGKVGLYSHGSLADEGQHIVRVIFNADSEVAMSAPTRGEAMLQLGEYLQAVGRVLKLKAFEQEGAVRIPRT